jgi:hypothetical protein
MGWIQLVVQLILQTIDPYSGKPLANSSWWWNIFFYSRKTKDVENYKRRTLSHDELKYSNKFLPKPNALVECIYSSVITDNIAGSYLISITLKLTNSTHSLFPFWNQSRWKIFSYLIVYKENNFSDIIIFTLLIKVLMLYF